MTRAGLTTTPRSLARVRFSAGLTRWLLYLAAAVGVIATVRFTLAPPRPVVDAPAAALARDPAAEGFAELFARRYLTFDAADPDDRRTGLAQFLGEALDPDAGLTLPTSGRQRVRSSDVVQERPGAARERVYTVAVESDRGALVYLSVAVQRTRGGALRLGGYPAIVGAPETAPANPEGDERRREVSDRTLARVVTRALTNYLAGSAANLAADLSERAHVALPAPRLELERVLRLVWAPGGRSVLATLRAGDARGTTYTLRYELDVVRVDRRWAIGAIQMDPTT